MTFFVFLFTRRMIQTTLSCLTRTLFFVMGFQVKVKGKVASLLEAPIIVAAPHSSFFDAIISALTGMPSVVSRAENLSTPVFGSKYLWKTEMLEVGNLTWGQKSYIWFRGRLLYILRFSRCWWIISSEIPETSHLSELVKMSKNMLFLFRYEI